MPSQKMLKKFFWAVTILLGLTLGIWLSLTFILQMEEINRYAVVYNFWNGVYLASKFVSITLAACMVLLFVMRIIVAIYDEVKAPNSQPKPDKKQPEAQEIQPPEVDDDDWEQIFGDLSMFD